MFVEKIQRSVEQEELKNQCAELDVVEDVPHAEDARFVDVPHAEVARSVDVPHAEDARSVDVPHTEVARSVVVRVA